MPIIIIIEVFRTKIFDHSYCSKTQDIVILHPSFETIDMVKYKSYKAAILLIIGITDMVKYRSY